MYEVPAGFQDFSISYQEMFSDDSYGDTFFVLFTAEPQEGTDSGTPPPSDVIRFTASIRAWHAAMPGIFYLPFARRLLPAKPAPGRRAAGGLTFFCFFSQRAGLTPRVRGWAWP